MALGLRLCMYIYLFKKTFHSKLAALWKVELINMNIPFYIFLNDYEEKTPAGIHTQISLNLTVISGWA